MRLKLTHDHLGVVYFTDQCEKLQSKNPDSTSIFVEHDGEIKEVTKHFVHFFDESFSGVKDAEDRLRGNSL